MDVTRAGGAINCPDDRPLAEAGGVKKEVKLQLMALLNGFECSICSNTLPEHHHVISRCSHHFCYPCIGRSLLERSPQRLKCPKCRQLIPVKDRHKILEEFSTDKQLPSELFAEVDNELYQCSYLTGFEKEVFDSQCMSKSLALKAAGEDWDVNAFHLVYGSYLQWALNNGGGFSSQLKLFLSLGIDVNVTNSMGRTPLLFALQSCYFSGAEAEKNAQALLEAGADPNCFCEIMDERPLFVALGFTDKPVRAALIRLLLRYGANPAQPVKGGIPLHFCQSPADADAILEFCPGLDVNHKDKCGVTPLARAAINHKFEMLTYWINKGADLQCSGVKGHKDLLSAMIMVEGCSSFQQRLSVIRLLLDARGWSSAYDLQSAIKSAVPVSGKCSAPQLEIVKLLIGAGEKAGLDVAGYINTNHLLHGAIKRNDYQLAECLVRADADISVKDESLKDCLDLVCENESRSILWLIKRKYPEVGAGQ